jgi:hypothetical protein
MTHHKPSRVEPRRAAATLMSVPTPALCLLLAAMITMHVDDSICNFKSTPFDLPVTVRRNFCCNHTGHLNGNMSA